MVTELKENWKEVLAGNRLSVVKVYADWCGPCKAFKPHFHKWAENYSIYNDTKIHYYSVDNDQQSEFKESFTITHYPSIMFFVYGIPVYTIRGMTRPPVFEDMLKKSLELKFEIK